MNTIHCLGLSLGLFMCGSGLASTPSTQHDVVLQELDRRIYSLEFGMQVQDGAFNAEVTQARFNDAMSHWMTGEHLKAAEQFQVLAYGASPTHELYPQIEWYLADSLHQADMTEHAEDMLQTIAANPAHLFHNDATRALLLWYAEEGSHRSFWDLARTVAPSLLERDSSLAYTLGRSQLILGAFDLAEQNLSRLSPSGPFAIRSRYLLGTIALQRGDDLAAEALFLSCLALSANNESDAQVHDLAHLARARIDYVRGHFVDAARHYGKLSPGSPHLRDALYELTWTHVASDDHAAALHVADLLFLQFPDHPDLARIELLVGHLHYTDEQWERADSMFERIVDVQLPVHQTVVEYINDTTPAAQLPLPTWAEERISHNEMASRSALALQEVARSLSSVETAHADLARVATHLDKERSSRTRTVTQTQLSDARRLLSHTLDGHLTSTNSAPRQRDLRRSRQAFSAEVQRDPSCVTGDRVLALLRAHDLAPTANDRSSQLLTFARRLDRVAAADRTQDPTTHQALEERLRVEANELGALTSDLLSMMPLANQLSARARSDAMLELSNELVTTLAEAEARRADIVWRGLTDLKEKRSRLSMNHNQDLYELQSKYETVRSMIE